MKTRENNKALQTMQFAVTPAASQPSHQRVPCQTKRYTQMTTCMIGFSVVCALLSVGLKYRFVWTWYAGWFILFMYAGLIGSFFFSALLNTQTNQGIVFAALYSLGGFLFWMPFTLWWSRNRSLFGKNKNENGA